METRRDRAATFAIHNRMKEISLSGIRNTDIREYGIPALAKAFPLDGPARLFAPVRPIVAITIG